MAKNENIKALKPKMDISFDIKPKTEFKNNSFALCDRCCVWYINRIDRNSVLKII